MATTTTEPARILDEEHRGRAEWRVERMRAIRRATRRRSGHRAGQPGGSSMPPSPLPSSRCCRSLPRLPRLAELAVGALRRRGRQAGTGRTLELECSARPASLRVVRAASSGNAQRGDRGRTGSAGEWFRATRALSKAVGSVTRDFRRPEGA